MKTCKECKWWGAPDDSYLIVDGELVASPEMHRLCVHPKLDQFSRPPDMPCYAADGVISTGNDAGWVGFAPGPDFGCIHFAAK